MIAVIREPKFRLGIMSVVSLELAPMLYRDIGGVLAANAYLSDAAIAASYISFVRDLY